MDERAWLREELIETVATMGFPAELGMAAADQLRTEWAMRRMLGYLRNVKPKSAEELVDEMLAILEDRERWTQKKISEQANAKYSEYLRGRE